MKKFLLPLGICLAGITTVAVLVVAKPKPVPQPPPGDPALVQVEVTPLQPQPTALAVTVSGTVTPKREITVIAQVSGEVTAVGSGFVDGGFFASDEELMRIDDADYQAALLQAQARVAEAQQAVAEEQGLGRQAQREWRDLGDESANELFMRKPQLAAAKARLASAQAELNVAQLNLERTHIHVPYAGRVKETLVDLGQYVSAGTALATVYDSAIVEVRLPLTEQQASLIDLPFATPHTETSKPEVTITGTVAGQTHQWTGHLVRTQAFVDADTRMYTAVVEVADPFAQTVPLLPGLFVEARIDGRSLEGVSVLPRRALFKRDKLLTLDDDNAIVESSVSVLHKSDEHIWVRSDLPGNTLVSLEKQSLTPVGVAVDPRPSNAAEPPVTDSDVSVDVAANSVGE